ncbi:hypothetical protein [Ancylobacter defluvii]|uniref:DUF2188 domain-containing protein n=1 Tax=Ancylobacter defluvii TaxID=1282440 RepID=A0A9W6JV70_9HYPH|nr:hypothetical protein [Ancylobacter defluvii]MBS7590093.1 hypothetical protein [Ancylobacter defluvii]GLK82715.1 hypothetical protein GCM10017653_07840 [Ancylobacter defluvii]
MQTAPRSRQDIYRIRGSEADWHVEQSDHTSMSYASKEAAFEAAVAAASNAIRDGHEVVILVPASRADESTLGVEDPGSGSPWTSLT